VKSRIHEGAAILGVVIVQLIILMLVDSLRYILLFDLGISFYLAAGMELVLLLLLWWSIVYGLIRWVTGTCPFCR
jgi:hypothetical protein